MLEFERLHSHVHMLLDPSTMRCDLRICSLIFTSLPAICGMFLKSAEFLMSNRRFCKRARVQSTTQREQSDLHTILHVKSSGPKG